MNRIITISREFGSGGRTVGKKVAEKLGIPAMTQSSSRRSPRRAALRKIMSRRRASTRPAASCPQRSRTARSAPTNEDILWEIQCRVISELAEKGALRHRRPLRGLHFAGQGQVPQGLYPRGYGVPRPSASSRSTASASQSPGAAPARQGQAPRGLSPLLHEHEVGLRAELPHHARQRRARHRQVRRHHR